MKWALRYTSHLGYLPPDIRPQFLETLGTADVVSHIEYAAGIGMAGVLYPWAIERPDSEVASARRALVETGLRCSCIVSVSSALTMNGIWTSRHRASRRQLAAEIARSSRIAASLGSSVLATIVPRDSRQDEQTQRDNLIENLAEAAEVAAGHGLTIGLEPMTLLPGMLLRTMEDGLDVVRRVARSNVGLIYDAGHVSMTHEDLVGALVDAFQHIVLIQIADQPNRVEPGAGELGLVRLMSEALRLGYGGLVDLEHLWVSPTREGEAAGLARVRQFDDDLRGAIALAER
jgi:hydroxypyruvate isomerase